MALKCSSNCGGNGGTGGRIWPCKGCCGGDWPGGPPCGDGNGTTFWPIGAGGAPCMPGGPPIGGGGPPIGGIGPGGAPPIGGGAAPDAGDGSLGGAAPGIPG